jgi:hypothetical protein
MDDNPIQSIFLHHGQAFRNENTLSAILLKAMQAIEKCATERSGFHTFTCDHCGHTETACG